MQISAIQSLPPIAPNRNVQLASSAKRAVAAQSSATPSTSDSVGQPGTTSSGPTGAAAAQASPGAQSISSSIVPAETSLAAVYSATIHGATYSGSVEETGGDYAVSIGNLPGASASGTNIEDAEDRLGSIIDMLV